MKNKFGFLSVVLLGINGIIGSGIFLMPGQIYAHIGKLSIIAYFGVALLAICIALCYAEVSSYFSKNGAAYVYVKEAFGDFLGFEIGMINWIALCTSLSAIVCGAVSSLEPYYDNLNAGLIIISVFILLGAINLLGVRLSKYANNFFSITKLIFIFAFIVIAAFFIDFSNLKMDFSAQLNALSASEISAAFILIFYAFAGFENIAIAAQDMDKPQKTIPLAIIATMLVVSIVYILVQLVCVGVLGDSLANNPAPLYTAFELTLGEGAAIIFAYGTLISIIGISIALSFAAPRLAQALANDGFLPRIIAKNSGFGVPCYAIIITCAIACVIALSGSFTQLAMLTILLRFGQFILTCLSLVAFRLRGKKADFMVPGGYFVAFIAICISLYLVHNSDKMELLKSFAAFIVVMPIYFIMKKRQNLEFQN